MNIAQAVRYKLIQTAAITAYTSNRIYPVVAPQGAGWPCIIYSIVSNPPYHAMINDAPIYSPRIQISCWTTSYSQAMGLSKAVDNNFRDFGGVVRSGGPATTGLNIQRAFFDNEGEMTEFDERGKDISYHKFQQYIVWHTSTTG